MNELTLKQKELILLQKKLKLKESLPHLYGMKWYTWAHEFFNSRNKECFLTAGNQLSKSSTQIRKCIDWATDTKKWPELWPTSLTKPNVFWYFYPTMDVADEEFELKWKQFLPQGAMQDDPIYGWKPHHANRKIASIKFNSGVEVIFKSYAQSIQDLQTGTIFAIFLDEECPLSHWPELQARLNASDGYLSCVFTATLGQDFFRKIIEGKGGEELHPTADKWQVTLFDCLEYEDGVPSPWTFDKAKRAIMRACSDPESQQRISQCTDWSTLKAVTLTLNDSEVQRRILGKFVFAGGRLFEGFTVERATIKPHPIPSTWLWYGGVDYGSGGTSGHPSAMCFLAVSPDFKMGRIVRTRRMDGIQTTSKDLLDAYVELKKEMKITPVLQTYDYSCRDLHTFAARLGEPFQRADKDRTIGIDLMNTLFKYGIVKIFADDNDETYAENQKLITELCTVKPETRKNEAEDDACDAARYAIMAAPWDMSVLADLEFDGKKNLLEPKKAPEKTEIDLRREAFFATDESREGIEGELSFWDGVINEFDS